METDGNKGLIEKFHYQLNVIKSASTLEQEQNENSLGRKEYLEVEMLGQEGEKDRDKREKRNHYIGSFRWNRRWLILDGLTFSV